MANQPFDVIVLGGGAAGLMCALEAGKRGRRVAVLEHADRIGKKILISGGGRCNFTNLHCRPDNFLSANPHFCKSALARYTPASFIELVEKQASCELYGLLKRPDEKYVTERAYDNPKFVEDMVRDVAALLVADSRIEAFVVESENFESIHNHSAYAMIEKVKTHP